MTLFFFAAAAKGIDGNAIFFADNGIRVINDSDLNNNDNILIAKLVETEFLMNEVSNKCY